MMTALEKLVKPCDCALAFGLPLTEEEVRSELSASSNKDWIKHFSAFYPKLSLDTLWRGFYVPEVVRPVQQLIQTAQSLGVTVYPACSLQQLTEAAAKHDVLTLVSHWTADGEVELRDGLHSPQNVAELFPAGYDGVLDLMICQSVLLAATLKQRFPNCVCICNAQPARLRPKLFLYGQTLVTLQNGDYSYSDALLSTYGQHIKRKP